MNERLHIEVPRRPRGQLPRKYRLGLDPPAYRWRTLGWLLLTCAAISGIIALSLSGK